MIGTVTGMTVDQTTGEAFVRVSEAGGLLSARELEVLRAVADGGTSRQAGELLRVSEDTIKTHVWRVSGRLGARSRAQMVHLAWKAGLLR